MNKAIFIITLFIFFSCDDTKHIRKYSLPKISTIQNDFDSNSAQKSHLPFSWIAPDSWIVTDSGSMGFVVGKYKIPHGIGNADLSISYFKGNVGGLLQNVNRWRSQIKLDALTIDEVNAMTLYGNSPIGEYKMFKIINESNLNRGLLCFMLTVNQNTVVVKLDCAINILNDLEDDIKNFINTFNYNN